MSALGNFSSQVTLPDKYYEDLRTHHELLGLSDPSPVTYLLKLFVYLSSNSRLPVSIDPRDYSFFDWIIEYLPPSILDALLSAGLRTSDACTEYILEHALTRGNLVLARTLLERGSNLLRALAPSIRFRKLFQDLSLIHISEPTRPY